VQIGVIGASDPTPRQAELAEAVGERLAKVGATLICGGLGGVMEASCRGAVRAGGLTVGLLPGADPGEANPYLRVVLPTGLGELRNGLVVRASAALIAIGTSYGTLSEIALARRAGKSCVLLESFAETLKEPPLVGAGGRLLSARSAESAVALALQCAGVGG